MRFVDFLISLVGLIGIAATGWWAVHGGPTQAVVLENRLESLAETALAEAGQDWASVEMNGQTAVLTGQSPSHDSAQAALSALRTAEGPGGVFLGGVTVIRDEVAAAPPVSPYVWAAERTEDGRVRLTGHVPSLEIMDSLDMDAEAIAPGEVENELKLGTGEPLGDWLSAARLGLIQLERLETGTVTLTDSRLVIIGETSDDAERARVMAALETLQPPYTSVARLGGGGLWKAGIEGDVLVLSGAVRNPAERNEILVLAEEYFDGQVRDDMRLEVHGHDGWLDAVRVTLPHFAKFRSGVFAFDPDIDGFRVEGQATDSVIDYLGEDLSGLAQRYPVRIDAEPVEALVEEIAGLDFTADRAGACEAGFGSVLAANSVTFESGSANISRDSGLTLDKLLAVARRCSGLSFEVRGHTDSAGDRAFNIRLSEERAAAVAEYLAARGIPRDRLDPVGFGPDEPVASNDTRDGRAANRRIEFKMIEGE